MVKLLLYGIHQFGLRTAVVILVKFIKWWLAIGRRYQPFWQLGQYMFRAICQERVVKFNGKYVIFSQLPPLPSQAFDNMLMPLKPRNAQTNRVVLYPSSANIAVTGQCPFHCWHCSAADRVSDQEDLPLETWKQIIQQLQDAGVYYLGITGGEPLCRNDLEEIISSADQRSVLALATSGIGLTLERARGYKEAGLFYMLISLDHYGPEDHNQLRGSDKAYEAAIEAVRCSKEAKLYTILQAVITHDFVKEDVIWGLAERGKELEVQEIRCRGVVPAGRLLKMDRAKLQAKLLTEEDRRMFMKSANEINSRPDYPKVSLFEEFEHPTRLGCNAGGMHVYVDYSGNLCPCDYVPLRFGNLCEETFEVVWSRMRSTLGSPQTRCLACFVADYIADQDLKLPLPFELSREICQCYRTSELPGFFL